jgi:hypothetical protein
MDNIHVRWQFVPFSISDRIESDQKQVNRVYNQDVTLQSVESMMHLSAEFLNTTIQ